MEPPVYDASSEDEDSQASVETVVMSSGQILVRPEPKSPDLPIADFISYFQRVVVANDWDDEKAARVFPALLEKKSRYLESIAALSEAERKSWASIQAHVKAQDVPYRDAKMLELFRLSKKSNESFEAFRDKNGILLSRRDPELADFQ